MITRYDDYRKTYSAINNKLDSSKTEVKFSLSKGLPKLKRSLVYHLSNLSFIAHEVMRLLKIIATVNFFKELTWYVNHEELDFRQ